MNLLSAIDNRVENNVPDQAGETSKEEEVLGGDFVKLDPSDGDPVSPRDQLTKSEGEI